MARNSKKKTVNLALGFVAALFWVGVWALCALWVGRDFYLPTPWSVLASLKRLIVTPEFWRTVGLSLLRVLEGYLPGVLLGTLAGILTAKLRVLDILLSPALTVVRATPVASFIMLALVFLGRNAVPPFIVFLMVLPIVWANVAEGVKTADPALGEVCRVYGFSPARKLKLWILPHCLPYFSSGALTALGLAWKAGIAAEVLCTPRLSIGKMVYDAKVYLETADLFAWTLVVILLSLILEKLLKALLRRGGVK